MGERILVAFPFKELKEGRKQNKKLTRPYSDGFVIDEKIGEYTYVIRNVTNGRRHTVHADLLKARPSKASAAEASAIAKQTETGKQQVKSRRGVQAESYVTWKPAADPLHGDEREDEQSDETASEFSDISITEEENLQDLQDTTSDKEAEGQPSASMEAQKRIPASSPRRTRSQGPIEDHPWVSWFPPGSRRWFQQ